MNLTMNIIALLMVACSERSGKQADEAAARPWSKEKTWKMSQSLSLEKPPFPDALDDSCISVSRLDDILEYALILGNGDINALLYSEDGSLVLRLTKNDVWDARLDASLDPPLPTLDRIKELAQGERPDRGYILPAGSTWQGPDSYHAHPYPCPRACADVRLGSSLSKPHWRQIRSEGEHNAWKTSGGAAVMSIQGRQGASNGYACGPLHFSTDEHTKLRVRLSGTQNARFYIDVMGQSNSIVFASKWTESPTQTEELAFDLPPGREVERLVLYTWTEDGERAENRFESVTFEGDREVMHVDLDTDMPPSCPGELDIHRAVAYAEGAPDGPPKAVVRAMAQTNVFLIESSAPAELTPISSDDLPEVAEGKDGDVQWLYQTIPGDLDWEGMSFAVALAAKGQHKAVAAVTLLESEDPVQDAVKLARSAANADISVLVDQHEAEWQRFWSASGVDIDDALLRKAWYRNLYFLRCVTKPSVISPGLFAGLVNDRPAWHGDYHTNYNIQQTFWGSYITNHPELAEPYDRLITEYLPRANWLAREIFSYQGAYFPHVLFAYEPSDPGLCRSQNGRQYIHHVWGFTIGVSGFTVQPLWWHYKYQPNREYLKGVAYPAVRDVAIFYADFIEHCQLDEEGKAILEPSVSPEHWGWTSKFERNRNGTFDIAMMRCTLQSAIEGASILGRDGELVDRLRSALLLLPDYPTTEAEFPVVVDVQGAPPITYNIAIPAVPVFPGDVVTWWSDPAEKGLFTRSVEKTAWNGNNSTIILGVARARMSMRDALEWLKNETEARLRPNGTLTLNRKGHAINTYGHYTEQFAVSMAISELLLQSVGDVIRVFPAWPQDTPARFSNLRAQGGFLVSSIQSAGEIGHIQVTSTAGGRLRLLSPWKRIAVRRKGESASAELKPNSQGIVEIDTHAGDQFHFQSVE
jgi:hypothetical protein